MLDLNYGPQLPSALQSNAARRMSNGGFGMEGLGEPSMPSAPGSSLGSKSGFGLNMDTLGVAVQGLGTIGNLWNAFQAQKLAKSQFNFSKQFAEKNLANQIKAYNTTLEDRGRSRATVEGQSAEQAAAYIDKNKL